MSYTAAQTRSHKTFFIHRNITPTSVHDDGIKWKHFPRYWPFVRGIHRSPVNPPHKGQWRGALMFSLICVWINGWVNNREAGDLRRYRAHYDVTVMVTPTPLFLDRYTNGSGPLFGRKLGCIARLIYFYTFWGMLNTFLCLQIISI